MVMRKWVFIEKLWNHMQNTYNTTESPIKKSSIWPYERKKALWTYETICKIHDIEHSWESNKDEFYLLTWAEEVSFCVWNNMKNLLYEIPMEIQLRVQERRFVLYSLTWAEEDIFAIRFENVAKEPVNWSWVFLELTAAQQWQWRRQRRWRRWRLWRRRRWGNSLQRSDERLGSEQQRNYLPTAAIAHYNSWVST